MRLCFVALLLSGSAVYGQFTTTLQPQTVNEFDQYASKIEQQLSMRWKGQRPFISIEEDSSASVMQGELIVRPGTPDNPVAITNGLIHDWVGAVFIPNTTMQKVLAILQDFDHHSEIYPAIVSSRLIRRQGNNLVGYWRLERKDPLVPVVLDVEQEAHYQEAGPRKWICEAYARNISELENAGTPREKKFPPGEGMGFLWRMYSYWSLEAVNDGVLAECRTLSLSRNVPAGLAWAIKPFIQSLPRESLASTLRNTRTAATK
ncbi:MAG: hypothetical protein WB992_25535 [Bryobacteraceae bacterium]